MLQLQSVKVPSERSRAAPQNASEPGAPRAETGVQLTVRGVEQQRDAQASGPAPWVGRELDARYRILCLLGEGRMGAMFLALHIPLQKLVAIKVVSAELVGNGEAVIRQTRAVIANPRFEHPHVVRANDCATLPEGGAYFVMQLVSGRGLGSILSSGEPLGWATACELGAEIADTLAAAESTGVVHRDLNPDNILLEEREDGSVFVKVLDFGIAQALPSDGLSAHGSESERAATWARTVIGTPGYMAPEQAIGAAADHRCDLYALGVILWECIAGRALWTGGDVASLLLRQMGEAAPSLSEVAADASRPPELDRLIARLLERNPGSRPAHAADVCDMLRCLADDAAFPLAEDPTWQPEQVAAKRGVSRWLGLLALACGALLCWGGYRWRAADQTAGTEARSPSTSARVESSAAALQSTDTSLSGISEVPTAVEPGGSSSTPEGVRASPEAHRSDAVVNARELVGKHQAPPRSGRRGAPAVARSQSKPSARAEQNSGAQAGGVAPALIAPVISEVRVQPRRSKAIARVLDLSVRGAVSTFEVRRALDRIHPQVTACYVPGAAGVAESIEVDVEVGFDERGRGRDPRTRGASSPAVRACVADAAASIVLARPPDTGLAKASWRVAFSSE